MLKNLGVSSVALGFVAGFTGRAIEEGVSATAFSAGLGTKDDIMALLATL